MEYYSALKRNEMLSHSTTWMNLEVIMLSERRQKDKHCESTYMKYFKSQIHRDRTKKDGCQGEGKWAVKCLMWLTSDKEVLEMDGGDGSTTL